MTEKRLREVRHVTDGSAVLDIAVVSDIGTGRKENQDTWRVVSFRNASGCAVLVADGLGGHPHGAESARAAVSAAAAVLEVANDPHHALAQAFLAADAAVGRMQSIGASGREISGTTLVAAVISDGRLQIANVGDSRVYLSTGQTFDLVTEDHSLIGEQLRRGAITAEQAARLPANTLTRAVTGSSDPADFFHLAMERGDLLMLCSDGLWGVLSNRELHSLFGDDSSPDAMVERACDAALKAGSRDNVTALACRRN